MSSKKVPVRYTCGEMKYTGQATPRQERVLGLVDQWEQKNAGTVFASSDFENSTFKVCLVSNDKPKIDAFKRDFGHVMTLETITR